MKGVMGWLTEPNQPSVRYLAMRDLQGASENELRGVREEIPARGWVRQILRNRRPDGLGNAAGLQRSLRNHRVNLGNPGWLGPGYGLRVGERLQSSEHLGW